MSHKAFRDLAAPETAHEIIEELPIDPGETTVPLAEARNRVLASRVTAPIDVPGFDRASKDGYAVRASDTFGADEADPVSLEVQGAVHAGEAPEVRVEPGTAVEVSTGAVLPPGADAMVMVEYTTREDDVVRVESAVAPGDDVMVAGADIAAGTRALGPGTELTPREIGLLSALGLDEVPVRKKPQVGIISTGDELVRPGEAVDSQAGQIYDVNSYTLASSIEEAGGEPVLYPHVADDVAAMEETLLEAAADCDLVVSSGSTSAGAVDVLYRVIEDRGELLLHGVAVKPGKPLMVGLIDDAAYVGLPGYPVSALTIFQTFVAPALRSAAGRRAPTTGSVEGRLAVRERYPEGRLRYMPVGLVEDGAGEVVVYPVDKGSGATTSLVDADGVVEMPPDVTVLEEGATVTVQLFSPDSRVPSLLGVGEDDPLWSRLLDELDRPRYLPLGSREGLRRLRNGVPDVAVATVPLDRTVEAEVLGGWQREWGLIVPAGNPNDVSGLGDLIDRELRFVNRDRNAGLRSALDRALEEQLEGTMDDDGGFGSVIAGYELTTKAHESPARRVEAGTADVGLGLRSTADSLGLGFVSVGHQAVQVLVNPERASKPGVQALHETLANLEALSTEFPGYQTAEEFLTTSTGLSESADQS